VQVLTSPAYIISTYQSAERKIAHIMTVGVPTATNNTRPPVPSVLSSKRNHPLVNSKSCRPNESNDSNVLSRAPKHLQPARLYFSIFHDKLLMSSSREGEQGGERQKLGLVHLAKLSTFT
jgi:hypothetical protein